MTGFAGAMEFEVKSGHEGPWYGAFIPVDSLLPAGDLVNPSVSPASISEIFGVTHSNFS